MKNKIKIIAKLSILVLMAYVFFNHIKNNLDKFEKIKDLEFNHFLALSFVLLTELIITGWLFKNMINYFKISLNMKEWFGLTILNSFFNYFLIKSGILVRGHYLKKTHNFPYKNYIIALFLLSLIQVVCASLISIIGLTFQYIYFHVINVLLFYFFIMLIIAAIFPFITPKNILKIIAKKNKRLNLIIESWLDVRHSFKHIFLLTIFMLFIIILGSLRIYLIYKMLFAPILFSSAVIIASIGYLSLFISLTPASLGIREMLMSYAAELAGENFSTAIAVASLDRAIIMFWIFLLGFIFSFWYFKKIKKP